MTSPSTPPSTTTAAAGKTPADPRWLYGAARSYCRAEVLHADNPTAVRLAEEALCTEAFAFVRAATTYAFPSASPSEGAPPAPEQRWRCRGCGEWVDGPGTRHYSTERDSCGYPVKMPCGPVELCAPSPRAQETRTCVIGGFDCTIGLPLYETVGKLRARAVEEMHERKPAETWECRDAKGYLLEPGTQLGAVAHWPIYFNQPIGWGG